MNKLIRFIIIPLVLSLFSGCAEHKVYKYKTKTIMVKPVKNFDKRFIDENINIQFRIETKKIFFVLENKTKKPITILWDKVVYIDTEGKSHPAVGTNALFSEKMSKPTPGQVELRERIRDVVVPVKNVEKEKEEWAWYVKPLFQLTDDEALKLKGKKFSIVMPMKVNGKETKYQFQFNIHNLTPI